MIDFIQADNKDIIITTNKIAITSDLNIVDSSNIISPRLLQSKSYLKILDILYYIEDTNLLITINIVKRIIQITYIFNNIVLALHLHIIKTSPKSDIAVI